MASTDNRIVKLEFDNASFEKNVSTSLTTIGKLNEAIAGIGTKGGLKGLEDATKSFSMEGMSTAIEGVSTKFLALSTIGITALANLTNKAVNAGLTIAKSLTIEQVGAGFTEYEQKLGAIQTIMAGSGENLATVNKKLQELNTYSDKTIYSFSDMTENIGKFTNAGVDLDTAVASIQGVANVAAVSGANANEAGRAMYNFAQALSKGHVQLIDWKSIELANMGTVEFKQQLIDAAEATGTLTKQGDKWVTSAGTAVTATSGFNESLTDQWLTTDVLTGTLSDYADETTAIGKKATAAAQDVKTFTQLMSTVKESIGSGWAQTFEILIGNFSEAKTLFTDINNVIGDYVGKNADARNELLQGWKDLGGRDVLIKALANGFKNLGAVLKPIKEAFRDIFPAMTSKRLFEMTKAFAAFTKALKPSKATIENIKSIFKGFFSVLEIGWEIIKAGVGLIVDLISELTGLGSGAALDGLAKIGDFFTDLNKKLIKGGGISDFFTKMKETIKDVIPFITEIKDAIVEFVEGLDFSSVTNFFSSISEAAGGVSFDTSAFDPLIERYQKLEEWMGKAGDALTKFGDIVSDVWDAIVDFFKDLGSAIGDAIGSSNFDAATDALSVGLLGGIVAMFAKFLKNGINIDFGGGFIKGITDSLDQLTGTLKAMETNLKAQALQKIAIAIGILTASVLVLSMIDSDDLAKAMTALAVGFGQLMAALALLNHIEFGPKDTLKMAGIATSLLLLSGAILVLTLAAKVMSTMDWDELARGLVGTAALLLMLSVVANVLAKNSGSMIRAGVGVLAMALALGVLGLAMKLFATMNWMEMIKGFIGVGVGLGALAVAMQLMPSDMAKRTAGLIGVAIALNLIAFSMKTFASMDWGELAKGFAGVAGGLAVMAGAMHIMPTNMGVQALSILLISAALILMSKAMESFADLSWEEIGKGIVTIAGTLAILAIAMDAMQGSLVGAASLLLVTFALDGLSQVIRAFAAIPLGDLLKGMLGIAIALGVLAVAAYLITPAIPSMLLLGAALLLIGVGFALFGMGAAAVAKAFQILAEVGKAGAETLVVALESIGKALPALATGFAKGILELIKILGDAAPVIVEALIKIIGTLLEGLTKLIPKAATLVATLITEILNLLKSKIPEYARAGLEMLVGLLTGIRDNIDDVVLVVSEIITEFLDALSVAIPNIIQSVANLIINLFEGVAEAVGKVAGTMMFGIGISFLKGFWNGIKDQIPFIKGFFNGFPKDILRWIGNVAKTIWNKGVDLITGLLGGITNKAREVTKWFSRLPADILRWIGNVARTVWNKGFDLISGLLNGIIHKAREVTNWFTRLPGQVLSWIGGTASTLWSRGFDLIQGMLNGINNKITSVSNFFGSLATKVVNWVGNTLSTLWSKGFGFITGLYNGLVSSWNTVTTWLGGLDDRVLNAIGYVGDLLWDVGSNIIEGLKSGIEAAWGNVTSWLGDKMESLKQTVTHPWEILSPSKFMMDVGGYIMEGFAMGLNDGFSQPVTALEDTMVIMQDTMQTGVKDLNTLAADLEADLSPKITPVMDLTQISKDAKELEKLLPANSTVQAGIIAGYHPGQAQVTDHTTPTPEINFVQNINAPKQLSTVDIYRQTRNQIAMAKEELMIP